MDTLDPVGPRECLNPHDFCAAGPLSPRERDRVRGRIIKQKARRLRRNQIDAERRLRFQPRNRRLVGYKFRRQHPIGPFIVDFVRDECRLIVELDCGQHAPHVQTDNTRTAFLESGVKGS